MIKSLMILSDNGLVIYYKDFISTFRQEKSLIVGATIRSLLLMTEECNDVPLSYVEFTNVALSLCVDKDHFRLICAVFHDPKYSSTFGKMLSRELLRVFCDLYSSQLSVLSTNKILADEFSSFDSKISHGVRNTFLPLLRLLNKQSNIFSCALIQNGKIVCSTRPVSALSLSANLQFFLDYSQDLSDHLVSATFLTNNGQRLVMKQIKNYILIVVVSSQAKLDSVNKALSRTILTLERAFTILENLEVA
ncbi:uncharacterized protein LOC135145966 isoform X2 [Zophobas morio]|uniref:uncharacterized protein LOC135145966 isoform X2 n=1 Tax=Zophobas morio TaxID=2755281 RepID=UPI003083B6D4